jgi:hypothetical protein
MVNYWAGGSAASVGRRVRGLELKSNNCCTSCTQSVPRAARLYNHQDCLIVYNVFVRLKIKSNFQHERGEGEYATMCRGGGSCRRVNGRKCLTAAGPGLPGT